MDSANPFAYNVNDLRTQKADSGGTRNFATDGTSPASPVLADGPAIYTPGLSEHRGSASKFYHGDALGSTYANAENLRVKLALGFCAAAEEHGNGIRLFMPLKNLPQSLAEAS